jgi:hypothetical protein
VTAEGSSDQGIPGVRAPWRDLGGDGLTSDVLERELQRELSAGHPLAGLAPSAVARRDDRDDVLFDLHDGRYAVVHLTWSKASPPDPRWPTAIVFASYDDARQKLEQDASDDEL